MASERLTRELLIAGEPIQNAEDLLQSERNEWHDIINTDSVRAYYGRKENALQHTASGTIYFSVGRIFFRISADRIARGILMEPRRVFISYVKVITGMPLTRFSETIHSIKTD